MVNITRMGCISSRADINDQHPNIFNVMNMNESHHVATHGQLELTETDIIFYKRGASPVIWPLKCLRRYGFDEQLFSFEAGRRCPTGPGIFVFKSPKAEQMFNVLQTHILTSPSVGGDDAISREFAVATPTSMTGTLQTSGTHRGSLASSATLVDSPLEPNYLEPVRTSRSITLRQSNGTSRLSSNGGGANGPLSPQTPSAGSMLPSPASNSVYYANDCVAVTSIDNSDTSSIVNSVRTTTTNLITTSNSCNVDSPTLTTSPTTSQLNVDMIASNATSIINTTPGTPTTPISYMNLLSPTISPTTPNQPYDIETNYAKIDSLLKNTDKLHLYMNVEPEHIAKDKELVELPSNNNGEFNERHCYANLGLGPGETELKPRAILLPHPPPVPILPIETPPAEHKASSVRQVNYIILDLDKGSETVSSSQSTPLSPGGSTSSTTTVESPRGNPMSSIGYATIDFDKTAALSHSVNPNKELDNEGLRKTRHNSKIHEFPVTKQNSSSISD